MGDTADMMLDGTLCEGCGTYMGSAGHGAPRRCRDCRRDAAAVVPANQQRTVCTTCGRRVKFVGLQAHMRDSHGAPKEATA